MPVSELDAYTRQQAYLEGYKAGEAEKADTLLEEAAALLLLLITKAGYATINEIPRKLLRKLIAEMNVKLSKRFAAFEKVTMSQMEKFLRVSVETNRNIAKVIRGVAAPVVSAGKLWVKAKNDPIAGPGITASKMLFDYFGSVLNEFNRTIMRAYANGLSPQELSAAIFGTKANGFRDGLLRKLRNQYGATVETLIQHVQQTVIHFVGNLVTNRYQWVSVIDSATTDICRGRNGNIYEYGSGPRPPAHYRCRSTIVPVYETAVEPPSFYAWVKVQPAGIQNDLLGRSKAVALRKGKIVANDIPRYTGMRPLTLEEYAATNQKVLTQS